MRQGGFTLVELLVVLAVTGLVTAGAVNFMVAQSRGYAVQAQVQEMEQNARAAMEFLVSALQRTTSLTWDGTCASLSYDADGDGSADAPRVCFNPGTPGGNPGLAMQAGRITVSGTGVPSGFPASFITQDWDGDGTPEVPLLVPDDPADPRVVRVNVVARTPLPDPNYRNPDGSLRNGGYRQILLTRRVVLMNR